MSPEQASGEEVDQRSDIYSLGCVRMGLGVNWSLAAAQAMLPSLVGHIIYGMILGPSYVWLRQKRLVAATTS